MSIHTAYRFGHYRTMEDGRKSLIWTPSQGEINLGDVIKGSLDDKEIMLREEFLLNSLTDLGEQYIIETFFRNNHTPVFFFRLFNDAAPAETDTMATLTPEVTGSGYGGISVARNTTDWGAPALDGGDMKSTSVTKSFNATGTWTTANQLVLASDASGTAGIFYAWVDLSTARTLVNGDQLDVSMGVKLA